jgi:hypothetical protein
MREKTSTGSYQRRLQIGESENAKKDLNKLNYKETIQDTAK